MFNQTDNASKIPRKRKLVILINFFEILFMGGKKDQIMIIMGIKRAFIFVNNKRAKNTLLIRR